MTDEQCQYSGRPALIQKLPVFKIGSDSKTFVLETAMTAEEAKNSTLKFSCKQLDAEACDDTRVKKPSNLDITIKGNWRLQVSPIET